VVDSAGIWCPLDSHNITFSVSGPGNYRGGADNYVTVGQPLTYHAPLDPELRAEGGMCKVAVRSMFTPGTVTVTATSPGLGQGTASFVVYPLDETTSVNKSVRSAAQPSEPLLTIGFAGEMVRYYIAMPCVVALDVLDATGRIVERTAAARESGGWHFARLYAPSASGITKGNGVYFVRFAVDGQYAAVKRVVLLK
jgi:hypothetical protein